ncbi:MAG: ABC transporter permease [Bdellovibrionaceae bacterium]|nr:ABC transporter permease [Pseudobdellovibrionaceae bacterium]
MIANERFVPFLTIYEREIKRFLKVSVQTVFSPLISSGLYLLIFGVSLGKNITIHESVSYLAFLIPGLVMMSILNNAFQNSSSSIISGKFSGDLEDWKISPLRESEILLALALGGLTRGSVVGVITFITGEVFHYFITGQWIAVAHPLDLLFFVIVGGLSFALFGVCVAFWARTFDQLSAVNSFILLPLIYLGGVFFSITDLHPIWQTVSQLNPLFYFINGIRHGLLGISDVDVSHSYIVSLVALVGFYLMAYRALTRGSYARW